VRRHRQPKSDPPKIIAIAAGGAGKHMLNIALNQGLPVSSSIQINSDKSSFKDSLARHHVLLKDAWNEKTTSLSIQEHRKRLVRLVKKADLALLFAGMGGSVGSFSLPYAAELIHDQGVEVVSVVTMPFEWESQSRIDQAHRGLNRLFPHCTEVTVLPNQALCISKKKDKKLLAALAEQNEKAVSIAGLLLRSFSDGPIKTIS
jgi:cell division protein FtsZ